MIAQARIQHELEARILEIITNSPSGALPLSGILHKLSTKRRANTPEALEVLVEEGVLELEYRRAYGQRERAWYKLNPRNQQNSLESTLKK